MANLEVVSDLVLALSSLLVGLRLWLLMAIQVRICKMACPQLNILLIASLLGGVREVESNRSIT